MPLVTLSIILFFSVYPMKSGNPQITITPRKVDAKFHGVSFVFGKDIENLSYSVLFISKLSPFPSIGIYDIYYHCIKRLEILLLGLQIIFLLFYYLAITHLIGLWSS